ncbi:hypothetical zinc finger protein [Scheffersomyces stipitis CBS 6054]|uniref:Hypothetical zinc finger protein n=1 Tax=Scheffersomyces stipitis (strain ATCC 58785 / CBS 6054 / NBRC 10063 / NRRL Y-11545) TaxID=322104 RepID=A3LMU5_PICST|nr:hypothetical zinc finger protein [Scheffersomyces stipitis CBS 6054]ABN64215.1 hypothetical zinc finger protein [Scheffersomyces stipitis CBS 6054]
MSSQSSVTAPDTVYSLEEQVDILNLVNPSSIEEYSEHLYKIAKILYEDNLDQKLPILFKKLQDKYYSLMDQLDNFVDSEDPIHSKVYVIVERNFDLFIKISTNHKNVELSTRTIRFLTNIIMSLNYWEVYNLLSWKPVIYHFLSVIQFDMNDCYNKFISDYAKYNYKRLTQPQPMSHKSRNRRRLKRRRKYSGKLGSPGSENGVNDDGSLSPNPYYYVSSDTTGRGSLRGMSKERRNRMMRAENKRNSHRAIKKPSNTKPSNKSSNYDPDVVHECQLPSPDEPHKLCLRRFSRKYELIRHQETVHSKKKKLFKCFVCVKQHPGVGPRIFTRHDTLAKHIRVNHKISGKEAKAEVAYSKKHAEVVEEGDITVHVGRRKTKVDFELRAHMEKRKAEKDEMDDSGYLVHSDFDSGDEEVTFNT